MNVLVVDDDPVLRLILQRAVSLLGHSCTTATNGLEAWDRYIAESPEVVISDRVMPGIDGLELCRRIRNRENQAYTYIILVTGLSSNEEILAGMEAGVDDYLTKPVDVHAIPHRLIAARRITAVHARLAEHQRDLERLNNELAQAVRTDPLTRVGNRMRLTEDLATLHGAVSRYGRPLSVALFDIDRFKAFNDHYGHQAGDAALEQVSLALATSVRTADSVYRYGGEEFICLFPEQNLDGGIQAAERARLAVRQLAIVHEGNPGLGVVTISGGVAAVEPGDGQSSSELLEIADKALYLAKARGRDRICSTATTAASEAEVGAPAPHR